MELRAKFQIIGELDYLACVLELNIKDFMADTRTPLERMIDKATGYDKVGAAKKLGLIIRTLGMIIRRKKMIGRGTTADKEPLREIRGQLKRAE
jgi:hypothetical protein